MKKFKAFLLALPLLCLTACGGSGNHLGLSDEEENTYPHVHISLGDKVVHKDVMKYRIHDDENCVILQLDETTWVQIALNNIILYSSDRCPLCNK